MTIHVSDSFTEGSDVGLAAHTGELGAAWTDHPHVNYTGTLTVDSATDRIYPSVTGTSAYYPSGIPGADCYSQADFYLISAISQNIAVCLRMHETDDTMYIVRFNGGTIWEMRRIVAGAATTLPSGTSTSEIPSVGNFSRGKFVAQGDQLSFYANGNLIIGPITDTNITAGGRVGVRNSGQASSSTGLHLDNFEAGTLDAPAAGHGSFVINNLRPAIFKPGRLR